MKRNYFGYPHFVPLMLWSNLATKTLEMMLASAQVIGHRTGRMALAGSRTPSQLIARQAARARALGQSALSMADASKGATRLAHRGLKPIHAKATANAKRLGRR